MAMSKEMYEEIAAAFRQEHCEAVFNGMPTIVRIQLAHLAMRLLPILKRDNPRFDEEKFYRACFID